jgi:hypothetical protein
VACLDPFQPLSLPLPTSVTAIDNAQWFYLG